MHDKQTMCEAKLWYYWMVKCSIIAKITSTSIFRVYLYAYRGKDVTGNAYEMQRNDNLSPEQLRCFFLHVSYEYCDIIVQRGKALHTEKRTRAVGEDG